MLECRNAVGSLLLNAVQLPLEHLNSGYSSTRSLSCVFHFGYLNFFFSFRSRMFLSRAPRITFMIMSPTFVGALIKLSRVSLAYSFSLIVYVLVALVGFHVWNYPTTLTQIKWLQSFDGGCIWFFSGSHSLSLHYYVEKGIHRQTSVMT